MVNSPRQTIKKAFQSGLIDDGHTWIQALEKRNFSVHTYDENTAKEFVDDILTSYLPAMRTLYNKLSEEDY